MRTMRIAVVLFVVAATASAAPAPAIVQVTANEEFSGFAGPATKRYFTNRTDLDLTPTAPGNADRSSEVFLIDLKTNALTQVTSLAAGGHVSALAWLADGRLLLRADGNLAPGGPTPAPGYQLYLYKLGLGGRPGTTTLLAPSIDFDSTFFRLTVAPNGKTWLIETTGDLVPGGNADHSYEVYAFDSKKQTVRQLTNATDRFSELVGFIERGKRAVIRSSADLTGLGTNASDSGAAFLLDLKTFAFEQVTSDDDNLWDGSQVDSTGRWIALRFLVLDGMSLRFDTKIYDVKTKTLVPAVRDGSVQFVPGASLALLNTAQDLVPSATPGLGNADGSYELFTMDLKTGAIVQRTASAGHTVLYFVPTNRNGPVIVSSTGDLAPGAPGNAGGVRQVFLVSIAAKPKPTVQVTAGAQASDPDIVVGGFLVIASTSDLVPGGNADGSYEEFVANLRGAPKLRQLTSAPAGETYAWGSAPPDGRSVFLASTSDLAPGAPGNADGSEEIYRVKIR